MKPSLKQVWNEKDLFVVGDIENPGQSGFWAALSISILLAIVALPIWTKREALRDFYTEKSFPCEIIDKKPSNSSNSIRFICRAKSNKRIYFVETNIVKNYQYNIGDNISWLFSKEDINHYDEKSGYKPTYENPISVRIYIGVLLWCTNITAILIALAGIRVFGGWKRNSIIAKLVVIGTWGCFVWLEVYLFIRVVVNLFC